MNYIAYIFSLLFFRILAILPSFLIRVLSDLLFVVLYYIAGYRKRIARKNITNSFPHFTDKEIEATLKKFYRHLSDIFLEIAVSLYLPKRRLEKMYLFEESALFEEYYQKKRNIIVVGSHYNNWEWAVPFSYTVPHTVLAVYKPIKNRYIDRTFRQIRGRYGARVVPMNLIGRELFESSKRGELTLTGMVADQRPIKQHIQYWTDFLHQKTPVFPGTEKLAIKFDAVVIYIKTRKVKRGVYRAEFELITDNPRSTEPNWITERHTRILEEMIIEEPAYWLWTHDRWKYSDAYLESLSSAE